MHVFKYCIAVVVIGQYFTWSTAETCADGSCTSDDYLRSCSNSHIQKTDTWAEKILKYCVNLQTPVKCGPLQRVIVHEQWRRVYGGEKNRIDLARDIWIKVFRADPALKDLLKRWDSHNLYSPLFQVFMMNSIGRMETMLYLLEDPDMLLAMMSHYAGAQRGQRDSAKLQVFMSIFVDVVQTRVGRCFNTGAWVACLAVIAKGLEGLPGAAHIFLGTQVPQ